MRKILFAAVMFIITMPLKAQDATPGISVQRIWEEGEHNAFADLTRFKNYFYSSFREGVSHVGSDNSGKVRIIRSRNGDEWESVALLEQPGVDLRDPKISITPDARLMVIMAGAVFENGVAKELYPMVSFSDKAGATFSAPEKATLDAAIRPSRDWLWRVTWHKGIGYAINYQLKENSRDRKSLPKNAWLIFLMQTTDGKHFEKVSQLEVEDLPNEATIRFDDDDKMYVLIRREAGDRKGVLAVSAPPYQKWSYSKLNVRLGGPNFLFLDNETLVLGTRLYGEEMRTGILVTDLEGRIRKTITLPSGGDTSYPGMVIHKKELWVTYYSSHEGKSQIYLAKIPLRML